MSNAGRSLALIPMVLILGVQPAAAHEGRALDTDPGCQQVSGVSGLLTGFFAENNPIKLSPPPPIPGLINHEAHFVSQTQACTTMEQLNSAIVTQLSSFPLGSAAGSFTYTYDATLGVFTRSTETFGPTFAERAQTNGRGKLNIGLNYLHTSFSSLDGQDLDDGDVTVYLLHQDVNNDGNNLLPFVEGDLIEARLYLDISTDKVVVFANYGLTERLDVGVAVPYVSVELDARIAATIQRLSTSGVLSGGGPIHVFLNGTTREQFDETRSASGLGDVVLRTKYRFYERENGALAAALDLRLPTGKDEDLLGSGALQGKLLLVGSGRFGSLYPHVNVGYTFSASEGDIAQVPDELNYTVGFDVPLHARISVATSAIGRVLLDTNRLGRTEREFQYRISNDSDVVEHTTRLESLVEQDTLNLLMGTVGVKFNPAGNFVVSTSLFYPLNDIGLQSDLTVVLGVDYSF